MAGGDRAPLAGVRVVDLTQILAGPYCTRLLADAGAEVVKIEPPGGDPSRGLPPVISRDRSGYFINLNAGKLSVVADLRTADGVALVRDLVRDADVLVENMRPGSLTAKGLGYGDLSAENPRLIMASISAFGATGVFAGRPGQGIVAEGYSGAIDMTGFSDGPPVPLGISVADVSAGIHAYAAILTSLYRRDRGDGVGEHLDIALFDAALPFHETAFLEVEVGGGQVDPTRNGLEHRAVEPYGVYNAGDGYFVLAAGTDRLWARLAALLGPETAGAPDLATNDGRLAQRDRVKDAIERWARSVGGRDEAVRRLESAGIPTGPVRAVRDVADSEPARSRNSFPEVPDPEIGGLRIVNTPFRMSRSRVGPSGPAPRLGEHTELITHRIRKQNK
ncbi:CoA transferase [Microbacterium soli]|uniref:CoA transferase n=1 Tax=Microbacterium soli TaxID=446075 RepID=A0ABP7MWL3_9MICO